MLTQEKSAQQTLLHKHETLAQDRQNQLLVAATP